VRVYYGSSKPAQLQALAYTQGTDIHVGSGQEQHLAHEAWHVVQQKQGRVPPTLQAKGIPINDDEGLEKEADMMAERVAAVQLTAQSGPQQKIGNGYREIAQSEPIAEFRSREAQHTSTPAGRVAQMMYYKNTQTGFSFDITDNGRFIKAQATTAPLPTRTQRRTSNLPAAHKGSLRYSATKDSLVIEHIENEPELGSSLGPLLIYLAALRTQQLGFKKISVVGLRYPEYYARWGFDIETPRQKVREQYRQAGREDEIPKDIGVPQADSTTANVISKTKSYVDDRWIIDKLEAVHATAKDQKTLTEFPRIKDL
jgi:hypothetical protein